MALLKLIWNKVLCNRWYWVIGSLFNCLGYFIATTRGEPERAERAVLSAVVAIVFSFIAPRLKIP